MNRILLHTEMPAAAEASRLAGLARWRAECAGETVASPDLRSLWRRSGWTRQQVSLSFEALAGIPVRPAEGRYLIDRELTPTETASLTKLWLIRLDRDGWALTRKAEEMLSLLAAYDNPPRQSAPPPITLWNYI